MLLGTMLMLSGCNLFQSPLPLPPPQTTCEATPGATNDSADVRLAQRAPAYGGMFFDFDDQGNRILYVYLTDLSQEEAVKQAIIEILGPRWLELPMYPREIRVLQGQYSYLQLKAWHDCMSRWILAIPGITMTDIDDKKNRITIGIDIGLKAAKKRRVIEAVETALERLDIPQEAVILEEMPPAVPKRSS
jgi:hypothetical protein